MKNRILLALLLLSGQQAFMGDSFRTPDGQIRQPLLSDSDDTTEDDEENDRPLALETSDSEDDSSDEEVYVLNQNVLNADGSGDGNVGEIDAHDSRYSFKFWASSWMKYLRDKVQGAYKFVKGKMVRRDTGDGNTGS